jgi:hypothetical protein
MTGLCAAPHQPAISIMPIPDGPAGSVCFNHDPKNLFAL